MRDDPRPLTARSVLLSLLLGTTPPRAPVGRLVRTAGLFGIAEGTARTALSRMAAAGEVTADGGWYELASERLLARQARQIESRQAETLPWDGESWVQAVVAPDGRRTPADRARLRDDLHQARLAELREGVWLRPDNVDLTTLRRRADGASVRWFVVRSADDSSSGHQPSQLDVSRRQASQLWDLDQWADRATQLVTAMEVLLPPLLAQEHSALADGFVTSADVLRHFQADPLLPDELVGAGWPGPQLRATYDRYDDAYRACLATWFRDRPPGP